MHSHPEQAMPKKPRHFRSKENRKTNSKSGLFPRLTSRTFFGKNHCVQRHNSTNRQQDKPNPIGRPQAFLWRSDLHIDIRCGVVACYTRSLRELVKRLRTALVQHERIYEPELQSKQKQNYTKHEISVAIDVHNS